jgi:SAM-dependent methyltransferase
MNEIEKYWDNQWKTVIENPEFEEYSQSIPNDFRKHLPKYPITYSTILSAYSILDFACGTGHLLYTIRQFSRAVIYEGYELSQVVVDYANEKYFDIKTGFSKIKGVDDIINNWDIIICSNTLEHFKGPFIIIDKILKKCKYFLILVPNEGTSDGGYSGEGSAGHVYTFNIDSFEEYEILDSFTFYSHGWTEGLNEGLNPLQLCVLLKGEL